METGHLPLSLPVSEVTIAVATSVFLAFVAFYFFSPQGSVKVPYVGLDAQGVLAAKKRFQNDCASLLREGYEKYDNGWFKMKTPDGDRVIMPVKLLDELKDAPRETLSFHKASSDILLGQYSGIDKPNWEAVDCVRIDLTQNIGNLLPTFVDEAEYAFNKELPPCKEWTPVQVYSKFLRIISIVVARAFVPPSIGRTEDWIDCSVKYTGDVFGGGRALKKWNPLLRPVVYRFLKEFRDMRERELAAKRLMLPLLKERALAEKEPGYKRPNDFVQWMQDRSKGKPDFDFETQAILQLQLQLAAIHTTGMAMTHSIYDLAAHPEYIQPLRDEAHQVLRKHGGQFNKQALAEMRLMDSFMKESQRVNPLALATFNRKTLEPIRLSDGTYIPPGTMLNCNGAIISEQPTAWGDVSKFDGFRFARLRREAPGPGANKNQFVTTSPDAMNFGHGKFACPGRFFAAAEMKIVLAYLVTHYDVKLEKDGERPANIFFEHQVIPNVTAEVLFRRLHGAKAWSSSTA